MSIEDLYAVTPIPEPDPMALGLGPAPMAPQPMAPPVMAGPPAPSKGQQILKLAAMASMLAGGPSMAGLGAGVLRGQQQSEEEQRRRDHENRLLQDRQMQLERQQQMDYQRQQQAYQEQLAKRQQTLMGAVQSIRQQVGSLKNKAAYDQQVEGFANLLRSSGFRVDANWLRQAAPYVAPNAAETASKAIDQVLASPLTREMIQKNPDAVLNAKVSIDANGDGIPEQYSLQEAHAMAGRSLLQLPDGAVIASTKDEGKIGTPFQEVLSADLAKFRTENRREPNPKEKQQIVQGAILKTKEKPDTGTSAVTGEIQMLRKELLEQQVANAKQPKEPNQAEYTASSYAQRMEQANDILNSLEPSLSGMGLMSYETQRRMPAAMQSGDFQSFDQAARNFINAQLRRESGAVISPAEFENARRQYLPQPGDTPQTLEQKRINRQTVIEGNKRAAGKAYQPPVGAGETASAPQVGAVKVFPNGKRGRWDGTGWELVR